MEVVILDRFSGTDNPEGWLYRAERYFAFLGFAEENWLPLPSFYLEGEALTWFNWLFRNKQFFDWMHFKEKFIQHFSHQTKVYPVVQTTVPRNFQTSFAFRSAYETQTSKEDHVFDKLSDTVYSLVHEPSVVTKVPEFAEISYTTAFPTIHDEEPSALVGLKVSDTSIRRNDSLQPEVTIQVLDESSHGIKLKEVRSIAPRVSLLVPFDGPEVVRPNEHLERDMSMRYADVNSLASGSPKLKTDSETFVNWYLSDLFMEPVGNENLYLKISTSSIHSVKILPDTENGKSTRAFNDQNISSQFPLVPAANLFIIIMPVIAMDLCVWDPGICFEFMALTDFIENAEELLLLGCPCKFFLNVDSNSMSRVWDPGQTWCVHCYFSNGSCVMYNYIAFTCPSIAYELVVEEYYYVNYDVLTDNFKQTSVLRPDVSTSFDGKTESGYLVLVRKNHIALLSSTIGVQNFEAHFNVLPIGITGPMKVFGRHSVAHEVLSISAHHWSLKNCLHGLFHNWFAGRTHWFVFVVINGDVVGSSTRIVHLNKWVSGQRRKDNVQMPRHNNVSWRGNSGLQDGKYIDFIKFKYLVVIYNDARDGLQLSLPLFCVLTMLSWSVSAHLANYKVVELNHVGDVIKAAFIMMSILRILWPRRHLEKLQDFSCHNHVQQAVNCVDTIYKAWYEALDFSHKGLAGVCHQMHFVHLKVNVTAPRLPMFLLARSLDLNLEDKVLIEDGSIVMNQPQPNRDTNKDITQIDIGPSKSNRARPSQRIVWDPGPFTLC